MASIGTQFDPRDPRVLAIVNKGFEKMSIRVNPTTGVLEATDKNGTATTIGGGGTSSGLLAQYASPSDLILFSDSFDRADATAPGNGWTDTTASTWQLATQVMKPIGATGGTAAVWRTNVVLDPYGNVGDVIQPINVDLTGMTAGAIMPIVAYQPGGGTSGNGPGYYGLQITWNGSQVSVRWAKKAVGSADGLAYVTTAASITTSLLNLRFSFKKTTLAGVTTLDLRVRDSNRKILLDYGGYLATDSEATLQSPGKSGLVAWGLSATVPPFYSYLLERIVTSQPYHLTGEGDSITQGINATSLNSFSWFSLVRDGLGQEWTTTNLGVSGQNTGTMLTNAASRAAANFVAGKTNVMILSGGVNDFGLVNSTVAQVATNLQGIHAAWQAAGHRTIACTILPADHVRELYFPGVAAKAAQLNDIIRANAVAWGCKGLVDDGADPRFGIPGTEHLKDFYTFQDDLHPTDLGHAFMAGNRLPIIRQVAVLAS